MTIPCLSQNTYEDSLRKATAIIFIEHERLSIENPLLKKKIYNLEEIINSYAKSDSIQRNTIKSQEKIISSKNKKIKTLKTSCNISLGINGILLILILLL